MTASISVVARAVLRLDPLAHHMLMMGFAWRGELDPNAFNDWELMKVSPGPSGTWWLFVRNPDIRIKLMNACVGVLFLK